MADDGRGMPPTFKRSTDHRRTRLRVCVIETFGGVWPPRRVKPSGARPSFGHVGQTCRGDSEKSERTIPDPEEGDEKAMGYYPQTQYRPEPRLRMGQQLSFVRGPNTVLSKVRYSQSC